jgi:hypothetical protein
MNKRNTWWRSMAMAAGMATVTGGVGGQAFGQWLTIRNPGIPRLPDGTPNLTAPAPKIHDGKPDLSGLWKPSPPYISNIAADLKPGDAPFQPWAAALFKHRRDTESKEDPTGNCIPWRSARMRCPTPLRS